MRYELISFSLLYLFFFFCPFLPSLSFYVTLELLSTLFTKYLLFITQKYKPITLHLHDITLRIWNPVTTFGLLSKCYRQLICKTNCFTIENHVSL